MALEITLSIEAGIVILQKFFIGNQEFCYSIYNFFQLQENKTEIRVMIVVRRDLLNKIVMEYKINLVNHLYFIFYKIQKLDW